MPINWDRVDECIVLLGDALVRDPQGIWDLVERRVTVNANLRDHPTIQVSGLEDRPQLGLLGMFNGLCGAYDEGPLKNQGGIAACYTAMGQLVGFRRHVPAELPVASEKPEQPLAEAAD